MFESFLKLNLDGLKHSPNIIPEVQVTILTILTSTMGIKKCPILRSDLYVHISNSNTVIRFNCKKILEHLEILKPQTG